MSLSLVTQSLYAVQQILKGRLNLPPYLTNEARALLKKVGVLLIMKLSDLLLLAFNSRHIYASVVIRPTIFVLPDNFSKVTHGLDRVSKN